MEYLSALKKSVVAGLMIGIGCTVFLNMDNSIVASFLFGLGLFTIINLELNLFTGKIGYICKENCAETLITLVGNGIGVNIMAFLMKQTRVGVRLVEKAGPIVETKLSDTYISLFLLAVCCGMLMYIAVATFKKQPNIFRHDRSLSLRFGLYFGRIRALYCKYVLFWSCKYTDKICCSASYYDSRKQYGRYFAV